MAAQALYRKWRSRTFEEVVGQEHVTRTLRNALRDGRVRHAYLFTGPRGTGKTSTARLLAKAINCLNEDPQARPDNACLVCQEIDQGSLLDLIEIDAASNRGIDEIRDLREKVHFAPTQARYKVYVIDEVHMLTPEAFNALLKTLEEPPPHVIFVLATTEPHRIPDTVLSRCQRFDFRRIPSQDIVRRLAYILEQEAQEAEPAALELIARSADGSMRDAISLADQLLSYGSQGLTVAMVQAVRGTISGQAIADLVDLMAANQVAEGLVLINQLAAEGVDLRQLSVQLVDHLRSVLLLAVGGPHVGNSLLDISQEQRQLVDAQAQRLSAEHAARAIRLINQAGLDMRDAAQPQLVLELAWLDACQPTTAPVLPDVVEAPAMGAPGSRPVAGEADAPQAQAGRRDAKAEALVLPRATSQVPDEQVVAVLRANWAALLHAAESVGGGQLRGALRTLRHVVADGDHVYFAFEKDFSRRTVERPANKAALLDLLGQLLGRPVYLHCQVGTEVTGVASAGSAESGEAQEEATGSGSADDLAEDPVVDHARRELGAVSTALGDGT